MAEMILGILAACGIGSVGLAGSSTATLRLFAACRIELATAFATVMGAAAGCTIGLLLMSRFWWCAREGRLSTRVSRARAGEPRGRVDEPDGFIRALNITA